MLLSPFSSPRRLILLAVFLFFAVLLLVRNSQYSAYLPKYDVPTFTSDKTQSGGANKDVAAPKQDATQDNLWQPYKPDKPKPTKAPEEWEYHQDAPKPDIADQNSAPAFSGNGDNAKDPANVITPIAHPSYQETQQKIKELIDWEPLNTPNHWPSWDDYKDKDYDPNRWEGLPW